MMFTSLLHIYLTIFRHAEIVKIPVGFLQFQVSKNGLLTQYGLTYFSSVLHCYTP